MQDDTALESVVLRGAVVDHLLAAVDEALLHRRNALLLLDSLFDTGDLSIAKSGY